MDVDAAKRAYERHFEKGKEVAEKLAKQKGNSGDVFEKLETLKKLRDQGVITADDFEAQSRGCSPRCDGPRVSVPKSCARERQCGLLLFGGVGLSPDASDLDPRAFGRRLLFFGGLRLDPREKRRAFPRGAVEPRPQGRHQHAVRDVRPYRCTFAGLMPSRRWFGALVVVASLATERAAVAEVPVGEIGIDYVAPPSCPDARAFRAALDARLADTPAPGSRGRRSVTLWVRVTVTSMKVVGQLAVVGGAGAEVREIEGETCENVVSALGLLAALAVDLEPEKSGPPEGIEASSTKKTQPVLFRSERGPPADWAWSAEAGAQVGAGSMLGPDMAPVVLPFVGVGFERPPRGGVDLAARVRLGFVRGAQSITTSAGDASFRVMAAQLDVCPIRFGLATGLALRACSTGQLGAVQASGARVADAQTDVRAWLLVGVLGRVEWEVIHHLLLEAQGGVVVAATRHRYFVDPDTTLYRMPIVGGIFSGGLAIRFP